MREPVLSRDALGRVLAEARAAAGLSQEALGRLTGLGQTAISRIESGLRRVDAVELVHIAEELGVEAAELLAGARKASNGREPAPGPPSAPSDAVAHLLGQHENATADALAWVPAFLARLEELERMGLDG